MIKVLEVFGEPIISGGQEAFVNNLVTNMDNDEIVIDLYTPYYCGNENYKQNVLNRNGKVFEAGLPFTPGKSRKNIIEPLRNHLQKVKYDVVHIHSGSVSVLAFGAKVARECGVKHVIVHSHSPAERETLKHILIKMATKQIMKKYPTNYLACSINAAEWKFPKQIADNHVLIVKNGINLAKYKFDENIRHAIREKLDIAENSYVIGHVGRFSHEKNHVFIISFFEKLLKKHDNAELVFAGDGDLMGEIKGAVKQKHLESKVHFLGNISNVNEVMQAFDVFVLPSLYEGLPLVGVEAQAAGLEVLVSTNVSDELRLTDSIKYLPINSADPWVTEICNSMGKARSDNTKVLREKGFDIKETVDIIESIYNK